MWPRFFTFLRSRQFKGHAAYFGWPTVAVLTVMNVAVVAAISVRLNQNPPHQSIAIPTIKPTLSPSIKPTAAATPTVIEPSVEPSLAEPLVEPTTNTPSSPIVAGETARVSRVVDGDTIELSTGQKVRYIGIDTPETVDPRKPVQCYGEQASAENKALVEGKTVTMVKDISEMDKYGRLLRYVYVDGVLVNDYLIRHGFARLLTIPPDVAMADQFRADQQLAQQENLGLWAVC